MSGFTLSLTDEECAYLHTVARSRISADLHGRDATLPPPPQGVLHEHLGAFVTLKRDGQLRGCIGNLVSDKPLYETVNSMAHAAAFEDPRFPAVTKDEEKSLSLEISVMGPITPCSDPQAIIIGKHGLIARRGNRQGLLLPQVPVEWQWDRETFLAHTCMKAGLEADAWLGPATTLYWFEAIVL